MQFFVGTSGYSYKEWKGSFYPEKLPAKEMLSFYAQHFSTVEINNTFYKMPTVSVVESWAQQAPNSFRFVLKAPQAITHFKRLKAECQESLNAFLETASALKKRQGPLLFQLPPNFKKDVERLDGFLKLIPKRTQVGFEFRHESWFDADVYACLKKHSCVLCTADADELPHSDLVSTAKWGMVRLRREKYSKKQLADWVKKIKAQDWSQVYLFFKHEDTGTGPKFASQFLSLV
jgi:uncharacterized protein YecE (DUF72 family)